MLDQTEHAFHLLERDALIERDFGRLFAEQAVLIQLRQNVGRDAAVFDGQRRANLAQKVLVEPDGHAGFGHFCAILTVSPVRGRLSRRQEDYGGPIG